MSDRNQKIDSIVAKLKLWKVQIGEGKLSHMARWLRWFPRWEYELFMGYGSYERDLERYGDEDFFGPGWRLAWTREFAHAKGGFAIAFFSGIIFLEHWITISACFLLIITAMEVLGNSGTAKKRAFDILSWALGLSIGGITWLTVVKISLLI